MNAFLVFEVCWLICRRLPGRFRLEVIFRETAGGEKVLLVALLITIKADICVRNEKLDVRVVRVLTNRK